MLAAVGLSILILGISAGISQLFFKELNTALVVLGITTLGIAASFIPRVKQIEKSFQGGIYLILVFCLVFASMADISMFSMESLPLLVYILLAVPGALLLHGILSRIFKVDVDNFLIISVALSMSPPFVPVVAASLKNREIILPGLIIGLVGYALGNYIGILVGTPDPIFWIGFHAYSKTYRNSIFDLINFAAGIPANGFTDNKYKIPPADRDRTASICLQVIIWQN